MSISNIATTEELLMDLTSMDLSELTPLSPDVSSISAELSICVSFGFEDPVKYQFEMIWTDHVTSEQITFENIRHCTWFSLLQIHNWQIRLVELEHQSHPTNYYVQVPVMLRGYYYRGNRQYGNFIGTNPKIIIAKLLVHFRNRLNVDQNARPEDRMMPSRHYDRRPTSVNFDL